MSRDILPLLCGVLLGHGAWPEEEVAGAMLAPPAGPSWWSWGTSGVKTNLRRGS